MAFSNFQQSDLCHAAIFLTKSAHPTQPYCVWQKLRTSHAHFHDVMYKMTIIQTSYPVCMCAHEVRGCLCLYESVCVCASVCLPSSLDNSCWSVHIPVIQVSAKKRWRRRTTKFKKNKSRGTCLRLIPFRSVLQHGHREMTALYILYDFRKWKQYVTK